MSLQLFLAFIEGADSPKPIESWWLNQVLYSCALIGKDTKKLSWLHFSAYACSLTSKTTNYEKKHTVHNIGTP